jgi:hypothetical protein
MFIRSLGQIVALFETHMTFYDISECIPVRVFQERENFIDFTYMPCVYKIVIAKQNRQVIFYDIRTHEKHPFAISATVEAALVPKMTVREDLGRPSLTPLFDLLCSRRANSLCRGRTRKNRGVHNDRHVG